METVDFGAFPGATSSDPFALVKDDIKGLVGSVKELIGVDHPVLSTVAKYVLLCRSQCADRGVRRRVWRAAASGATLGVFRHFFWRTLAECRGVTGTAERAP